MIRAQEHHGGALYFDVSSASANIRDHVPRIMRVYSSTTLKNVTVTGDQGIPAGTRIHIIGESGTQPVTVTLPGSIGQAITTNGTLFAVYNGSSWGFHSGTLGTLSDIPIVEGYVIGGEGATTQTVNYTQSTGAWTTVAATTRAREHACVMRVGSQLIVVGDESGGTDAEKTDEYDPVGNSWTARTDCPYQPDQATGCTVDAKGYIFAGNAEFSAYEFWSNTWTSKDDSPASMTKSACASYAGRAYIVPGKTQPTPPVSYHPFSNTYDSVRQHAGETRHSHAMFGLGSDLYMAGGWRSATEYTDEVQKYNALTDSWTTDTAISVGDRWEVAGFSMHARGYLCGGHDSAAAKVKTSHEFVNSTWTNLNDMPTAVSEVQNHGAGA